LSKTQKFLQFVKGFLAFFTLSIHQIETARSNFELTEALASTAPKQLALQQSNVHFSTTNHQMETRPSVLECQWRGASIRPV